MKTADMLSENRAVAEGRTLLSAVEQEKVKSGVEPRRRRRHGEPRERWEADPALAAMCRSPQRLAWPPLGGGRMQGLPVVSRLLTARRDRSRWSAPQHVLWSPLLRRSAWLVVKMERGVRARRLRHVW